MKSNTVLSIFVACLLLLSAAAAAPAQDGPQDNGDRFRQRGEGRGALMRELGLTPEQARSIGALNRERRPAMDEAQRRVREANGMLDEAIYADTVDEGLVAQRIKEVQDAQAEVAKIRFQNELAVRKILTHDQLLRFRELRERFGRGRGPDRPFERRRDQRRHQQGDRPMPDQKRSMKNFRRPI